MTFPCVLKRFYLLAAVLVLFSYVTYAQTGPDSLAALNTMTEAYANVNDYTAVFLKQELVSGELLPQETIRFKFKKPFKVYMGWMEGPHEGREALYVEGENDNKVIGHEGGFFGFITLNMDPTGSTAMRGNRHPITDVGVGRLIEIITENLKRALDEDELELSYIGQESVFGRDTQHSVAKLPPDKGYYGGTIEIWTDEQNWLPIKIMIFGWDGKLWESYGYKDLRLNPGLSDAEFEEGYEGYDF